MFANISGTQVAIALVAALALWMAARWVKQAVQRNRRLMQLDADRRAVSEADVHRMITELASRDERVLRDGTVRDQVVAPLNESLDFRLLAADKSDSIRLVVTDKRLIYVYLDYPKVCIYTATADDIEEVYSKPGAVALVAFPREFRPTPDGLQEQVGSRSRRDIVEFGFEEDEPWHDVIMTMVRATSDNWSDWREAPERLKELRRTPVTRWPSCIFCRSAFDEQTEHSVRCGGCGRYFSDIEYQPVVQDGGVDHGRLLGDTRRRPLTPSERVYSDWPSIWTVRPVEMEDVPVHLVPDIRTLQRAMGYAM